MYPPTAPYQPPPPPKRHSPLKIVLLSVGGVFGALLLIGIVGAAFGIGKQTPTAAAVDASTSVRLAAPAPASHLSTPSAKASPPRPATTKPTQHTTAAAPPSTAAPACTLPDDEDLIVRYIVPGLEDSAQELGEADLGNCTTTLSDLEQTSPMGVGYCTEVAWASDNPGYNADATPAAPLKKVIEAIGGSC